MPADLGYRFQPGAQTSYNPGQSQGGPRSMSPQDAVKLLSLRIPERAAPSGIAPQGLLTAQGGQGGGLQAIIQMLMRMRGGQPGAAGGGLPTPRVIPGIDGSGGGLPQGFTLSPDLVQQIRNTPLDSTGRTWHGGGVGGLQSGQISQPSPPLF